MRTTSIQFNGQYNKVQSFSVYKRNLNQLRPLKKKERKHVCSLTRRPQTVFPGRLFAKPQTCHHINAIETRELRHVSTPDTVTGTEVRFDYKRHC
jgi:hypothetical protein